MLKKRLQDRNTNSSDMYWFPQLMSDFPNFTETEKTYFHLLPGRCFIREGAYVTRPLCSSMLAYAQTMSHPKVILRFLIDRKWVIVWHGFHNNKKYTSYIAYKVQRRIQNWLLPWIYDFVACMSIGCTLYEKIQAQWNNFRLIILTTPYENTVSAVRWRCS